MRSLRQVLSTKEEELSTKYKVLSTSSMTSLQIRNRVLVIADGLILGGEKSRFIPWHCKMYKQLGEGRYAAIASMCRQPEVKNPLTLFGHLLKEEAVALQLRAVQ